MIKNQNDFLSNIERSTIRYHQMILKNCLILLNRDPFKYAVSMITTSHRFVLKESQFTPSTSNGKKHLQWQEAPLSKTPEVVPLLEFFLCGATSLLRLSMSHDLVPPHCLRMTTCHEQSITSKGTAKRKFGTINIRIHNCSSLFSTAVTPSRPLYYIPHLVVSI